MSVEMLTAIGALLVGIGSFIGSIMTSNRKLAVIETELKEVKSRLDSHNSYAQKFTETTEALGSMKTDIAVIKTKMEYITKDK